MSNKRNNKINETAVAGSVGAGAIAVNMAGGSSGSPKTFKKFMDDFTKRVQNKFTPKYKFDFSVKITESFDIESVFSRLASMEVSKSAKKTEGTTFGIEDDNGNIMKVTVRSDQADEFEQEVAKYLADIKMNVVGLPKPKTSKSTEVSIAELLFKLKDHFDIIDVDFPKIPSDVIYNADKASYKPAEQAPMDDELDSVDMDNIDDPSQPLDLTDFEDESAEDSQDEFADTGDMEEDEEDLALDMPEEDNKDSMLDKVISLLKAQAEAEIEKAQAEAEKARAEQARYTAQATQNAIASKEEEMRYELEMEKEKEREKEAKRLADIARMRANKTLNAATSGLREFDEMDTVVALRKQKSLIAQKWVANPEDDMQTRQYKSRQRQQAIREVDAKIRMALNKENYMRNRNKLADKPDQDGEKDKVTNISPEKQPIQANQQQDKQ